MSVLQIGGVAVSDPSEMTWTLTDLSSDNSGRNAAGDMLKDRIAQKVKLSCKWAYLSQSDAATLFQKVNTSIFFSVTYPDPLQGTNVTSTFYVGDRTAPMFYYKNSIPGWKDIAFDFIQK